MPVSRPRKHSLQERGKRELKHFRLSSVMKKLDEAGIEANKLVNFMRLTRKFDPIAIERTLLSILDIIGITQSVTADTRVIQALERACEMEYLAVMTGKQRRRLVLTLRLLYDAKFMGINFGHCLINLANYVKSVIPVKEQRDYDPVYEQFKLDMQRYNHSAVSWSVRFDTIARLVSTNVDTADEGGLECYTITQ